MRKKTTNSYINPEDRPATIRDIQLLKEEIRESVKQFREDLIQFKDDILHEIVDLRVDVAVVTGYRDMLEDHEGRLIKLEKRRVH